MKRYASLDCMKAIAALFVIYIHAPSAGKYSGMIMTITRIAVPFFFMVSGYFIYSKNAEENLLKIKLSIIKIFKLTIISNLIYFIWGVWTSKTFIGYCKNVFTSINMKNFIIFNNSPVGGHLWYLNAFLYVLILYYFICKYKLKNKTILLIPVLLMGDLLLGKYSLVFLKREFNFIIVRNFLFVGLPYFLIGNIIREKIEENKLKNISNIMLIMGVLTYSITGILERYVLVANNVNATRDHYISTTLLVVYVFIFCVINNNISNKALEKIGRNYSLYIYIIHVIVINIFNMYIVPHLKGNIRLVYSYSKPLIIYIVSLLLSIIYCKIKNKCTSRI